jgi:hypothetical protein
VTGAQGIFLLRPKSGRLRKSLIYRCFARHKDFSQAISYETRHTVLSSVFSVKNFSKNLGFSGRTGTVLVRRGSARAARSLRGG